LKKTFKHLLWLLVMLTGFSRISSGQDFLPTLNDNYMGINQAFLQPASIVDSRFRTDFNVAGFSNDIYNDAIRFRSKWLLDPTSMLTNEDWWDENTYISSPNGKDDNLFMSQSAIGPGFLANLSEKHSIGFTSRVRSILNIDGMDEPLFRLIYSNFKEDEYYNKWYYDREMRSVQHVFGDYGLTYARIIPLKDKKEHFLKAGITLKLLQGIASSYLQADEMYYYFNGEAYPGSKDISFNSPYIHGGLSDNWGELNQYGSYTFSMNYQFTAKPSVGMDLGVVYEFRRDMIKDGVDRSARPDKNKYFLKAGISLLDIGRLKYVKDYYSSDYIAAFTPDYANRYNTGDNSVPDNSYWLDFNDVSYSFRDYPDFSYAMHQRSVNGEGLQKATNNKENFTVRLPSAISLQADLNLFMEGLYVNLTTYHALNQGYSNVPNSHYISTYSITPRYEQKWYGVSVPVVINQYGKVDVGLGGRAGVVYFGVNNLFSNVFSDTYGMHGYVGVKVPIHYKENRGNNTISNLTSDHSKSIIQGEINNYTIIRDSFNKTISIDDHSIKIIEDSNDTDQATIDPSDGPDSVGTDDGSDDSDDGPGGSDDSPGGSGPGPGGSGPGPGGSGPGPGGSGPGSGGSGPGSGGSGPGSGGPGEDLLPNNSHVPDKISLIELINQRSDIPSIHFAFGDAQTSMENFEYLDSLAFILMTNSDIKITIEGHTDNVGSEAFNMNLSKIRADETMKYLLQKGVNAEQLSVSWFGESKPIDENTKDTIEGRNKNRRVEFKIEYDT
jgi:outer membrane protein OmpA-like peptidoglycan-associated protein